MDASLVTGLVLALVAWIVWLAATGRLHLHMHVSTLLFKIGLSVEPSRKDPKDRDKAQ